MSGVRGETRINLPPPERNGADINRFLLDY